MFLLPYYMIYLENRNALLSTKLQCYPSAAARGENYNSGSRPGIRINL